MDGAGQGREVEHERETLGRGGRRAVAPWRTCVAQAVVLSRGGEFLHRFSRAKRTKFRAGHTVVIAARLRSVTLPSTTQPCFSHILSVCQHGSSGVANGGVFIMCQLDQPLGNLSHFWSN